MAHHESNHVNKVQQAAIALLNQIQSIRPTTPASKRYVSRAHKQLLSCVQNLGRARTAEAQSEMKGR